MKTSARFVGIIASAVVLIGCVKHNTDRATQKSFDGGSCNLQDTASQSASASNDNFKCAYDALETVGKLSSGTAFSDMVDTIDGTKSLFEAMLASQRLFNAYEEYLAGSPTNERVADDSEILIDGTMKPLKDSESAVARCFAKNAQAFSKFYPLYKKSGESSGDQVAASMLLDFAELVPDILSGLTRMMDGLQECATALDGGSNIARDKLTKSLKSIAKGLGTAKALASCGVAIGRGGYVLANNSMCLINDVNSYYDSRSKLDAQRDNYVNNTPVDEQSSLQGSCMDKYGIFLSKQTFWTISTRASVCAKYCSGQGGTDKFFADHTKEIFRRSADRNSCGADVLALGSAVHQCITYCCDQENRCVVSAMSRLD